MPFAVDFIEDTIGGGDAADAARDAARTQAEAAERGIEFQRESRDIARADLQPFRQAGAAQLDPLTSLISDPQAQLDFIQSNPFFTALADDAQKRLFANQAARGKVGSGGTAQALQNSLLLLGQDLLNNNINQRFNLANMGQASAAGQANTALTTGRNITDLITSQGNAAAAGQIGAANARQQGVTNIANLGLGALAVSDIRVKTDLVKVGRSLDGFPIYRFRLKGDPELRLGVLAQDVEKVKPEAVMTRPDGLKAVDYSQIGVNHAY